MDGLYEPGRTYGAFAGQGLLGTIDSCSGEITWPGGAWLTHAAVMPVVPDLRPRRV
ncbi:hypothetical protein NGM99_11265 [Mesorhizobium sp. RP14(2022)]|uniref:Uncharacterized protein n=1 Tax=Mesorhizobium liriopis TaxID=2953882 RepID=A0ABT1C7B0_9HYPH|nr:hypothetical protein [Mesorhizobium liriopis]MCO6050363.1 hypothetical protein [Mesorhizobium liriopis]